MFKTVLDTRCELIGMPISEEVFLPFIPSKVCCGFPSPAEDFPCQPLSLLELAAPRPLSTFIMRVKGDSMRDAGIPDGSLISVDRSVQAKHGDVVVAAVDGEFTVKRLCLLQGRYLLKPANDSYPVIEVREGQELQVWGVVVACVVVMHK